MEQIMTSSRLVAMQHVVTTLKEISKYVGVKYQIIKEELNRQNVEINGAQIWKYVGCDGNPETVFDLYICIPVRSRGVDNEFVSFIELDAVSCISIKHEGPWDLLAETYKKGFEHIYNNHLNPLGNSREVYHVCDFENPENCITEIQIEIV